MKIFVHPLFYSWLLLPALVALAQENPAPAVDPVPPATAPAATIPTPAPTVLPPASAAVEVVTPASPPAAPVAADVEVEKPALRRLDQPATSAVEKVGADKPTPPVRKNLPHRRRGDDRVTVLNDGQVETGENINGDAVNVLGDQLIDGEVQGDAVTVLGNTVINGTVHGEVVTVLGDITLGPKSHVDGKIVSVGGDVHRAPGAYVGGKIVKESAGRNLHVPLPFQSWWDHGLKLGRPLAFGAGLAWLWIGTAVTLALYALFALLFPGGLRRTGDLLVQRPVTVVLSALFSTLVVPLLFVLLLCTVVGIPVALIVLPVSVILTMLFGKAAIYGLIGRRLSSDSLSPVLAVLAGAVLFVLLYLIPVAGLSLLLLVSALGFGCGITAMFTSRKRPEPLPRVAPVAVPVVPAMPVPPVAPAPVASTPASNLGVVSSQSMGMDLEFPPSAVPPSVIPPVIPRAALASPNAALARAGFGIRLAALLLDVVLVGTVCEFLSHLFSRNSPFHIQADLLPALAFYGVMMWKMQGTTVGGVVCGLRVVRLDDRPIDWMTSIVRGLGCFLSLIVVGLGFIWVLIDDDRQSWHDKIAGTVVVHAPKGTSLV